MRSCFELSFGSEAEVARHPRCRKAPPLALPEAGTLPIYFTSAALPARSSHGAAFHRIDHRLRGEMAHQNLAGFDVDVAGGRADLFIGVGRNVFHEEVQNARVALQNSEQLEGAIFRRDDRRWRWREAVAAGALGARPSCATRSSGSLPPNKSAKNARNAMTIEFKVGGTPAFQDELTG